MRHLNKICETDEGLQLVSQFFFRYFIFEFFFFTNADVVTIKDETSKENL